MPYQIVDLPLITPTSSGSSNSIGIGNIDDATSLTIFITSSAATTGTMTLQVSQFNPAATFPISGVSESSQFYNYAPTSTGGTLTMTASGNPVQTIQNISFRGFRLTGLTSESLTNTVAFASKQITV